MLKLSRYKGQRIFINDDIIVTLENINFSTGEVILTFEAPLQYQIDREEIYLRKKEEKYANKQTIRDSETTSE
jgi:carbon storage regulator CsrA